MRIAITDANIFIDLFELSLIEFLFQINLEIHTTQAILEELSDEQQNVLHAFQAEKQLFIKKLDAKEQKELRAMKVNRGFSEADKTLLFLAQDRDLILLTGERLMRNYFKNQEVEVHGIIWLFDRFVAEELCAPSLAIEKMEALLIINPRLPRAECEKRLKKWKTNL